MCIRDRLNTYWALIIPYVGFAIPLAVLLLTNYFKTIPNEIDVYKRQLLSMLLYIKTRLKP